MGHPLAHLHHVVESLEIIVLIWLVVSRKSFTIALLFLRSYQVPYGLLKLPVSIIGAIYGWNWTLLSLCWRSKRIL
jgi:hypothetical protein